VKRLSGLDAAFLALETDVSTGHVGGLSVLDVSKQPLDLARLIGVLEPRLKLFPLLRQRLQKVPFGIDQPVWVDDTHFDITYHIRELGLPAPGTDEQLAEQVARIHARPLDRTRPLWEMYLFTGLQGDRAAVYTKLHHSAIDGVGGTELLMVLYDLSPEGRGEEVNEEFVPERGPGSLSLGARGLAKLAWRPVEGAKLVATTVMSLPGMAPMVRPIVSGLLGWGEPAGAILKGAPAIAPATPLNVTISPHRRFAYGSVSLDEVKMVKNTFGVSVNDVVMAMCAGALRSWLLERDALPEGPLVAMVPVSIRAGSSDLEGNKVSAMLSVLPTDVASPVDRLAIAQQATRMAKGQQAAIPQGLVDEAIDFAPPVLVSRAFQLFFASHVMNRLPPFNTIISNVPGPNIPVYLAGAELLGYYPVSIVTNGLGLNITVIGYNHQLHFGLIAAREVVPDLDHVMDFLRDELATLVSAAASAAVAEVTDEG
jgi:diacylglycerol O-acyltransferase